MNKTQDIRDNQEWHVIRQESMLIVELIGSGITSLGKANHVNKGLYYKAFFDLSIGLERLCKLILVVDYVIDNKGKMPSEKLVKDFGHKINELIKLVESIEIKHDVKSRFYLDKDDITKSIIENLDAFADAKRGRYANFSSLDNPQHIKHESVSKWWDEVSIKIIKKYYHGTKSQKKLEIDAGFLNISSSRNFIVMHTDENRGKIDDLGSMIRRSKENSISQKWSMFYTLKMVRWLSAIYKDISGSACYINNHEAFFGSWEFFDVYHMDDKYLKSRKKWP